MSLAERLERTEKLGFPRDVFPVSYNGHELYLLANEGRRLSDDRVRFKFSLICASCHREETVRVRLPEGDPYEREKVITGKFMVFGPFVRNEC